MLLSPIKIRCRNWHLIFTEMALPFADNTFTSDIGK